jgi:hypothetical protein
MAAAEDDELIRITNEDINGNLFEDNLDNFRKYSSNTGIRPEILVILYLTYVYLYIQKKLGNSNSVEFGAKLSKYISGKKIFNTYAINLGIPTEWNNPAHIKRKIKFQTLLLTAFELSNQFDSLDNFLNAKQDNLYNKITSINTNHLRELAKCSFEEKAILVENWLRSKNLSVFPESAAGINYLLKTERLPNGIYATIDIGAGTTDIAIISVFQHQLNFYFCSESIEIAANDFYREYGKRSFSNFTNSLEELHKVESIIKSEANINIDHYNSSLVVVRGESNNRGIEFAVRKAFYRKFYKPLFQVDQLAAFNCRRKLHENPILIFGGGANLNGFCSGVYSYYMGATPGDNYNHIFNATPITNYIVQVEIADPVMQIPSILSILILSLGLTYCEQNGSFIPFVVPSEKKEHAVQPKFSDRYFYYDIQDAVYK